MGVFIASNSLYGRGVVKHFACFQLARSAFRVFKISGRFPVFSASFFSCRSSAFSETQNTLVMEIVKSISQIGTTSSQRVAIRADGKFLNYHQLFLSARNIAGLLLSSTSLNVDNEENRGLGGARVGIVAKPSAEFVAGVFGTWLCGGVAVPLALSYPEAELLHVMNDSDIKFILSTEDHQELMTSVAAKASAQLSLFPPTQSSTLQSSEHSGENREVNGNGCSQDVGFPHKIGGDDPALIIYTSGTTGKPKGVVHTHKGVLAQAQMLKDAWGYRSDDQFLNSLPLHHVHGLFNALLAPLYAGATVEFMPKFSVRGIWQRWRESYSEDQDMSLGVVTVFTGVPTMYTRLIQGYEAMDPELQSASAAAARKLRLMMCGSSALPLPVMQQWEAITHHRLLERYGMTEFVMALSNPLDGERKGGTVGKPLPGVEAKIIAEEGSENAGAEGGELCIKSPSLFEGYWKLPGVTKDSFTDDGFFRTGDAARVDEDGYYIILGRTSADIMKVGGYKLSALEIEAVLLEHPAISECCVLGLPDKAYGEAVTAIVVPDSSVKRRRDEEMKPVLSLQELSSWAKDKLAPYKIPTRLLVWESLPRNAMGKVNKKDLKKRLSDEVPM